MVDSPRCTNHKNSCSSLPQALAKKQQEAVQDVNRVRTMQIQFKADAMAEQAIREKEEFMRVLEVQQAQNAADAQVEIEAVKRASAHRNSILAQIEEREAEKVAARKAFLTEGTLQHTKTKEFAD